MHAYADGRAPGRDRLHALGLPFATVSAPGISEDIALLLAHERGAELIVAVGTHFNLVEFMERNRDGHGVDVRDPAQGRRGRSSTRRASRGSSRHGLSMAVGRR